MTALLSLFQKGRLYSLGPGFEIQFLIQLY